MSGRHIMVDVICERCGASYRVRRTKFNAGNAKYCSKQCFHEQQRDDAQVLYGYENGTPFWDCKKWCVHWYDFGGIMHSTSYQKWWWQNNVGEVPVGMFVYLLDANNENIDPANFAIGTRHDISMTNKHKQDGKIIHRGKDSVLWRDGKSLVSHPKEFTPALKKQVFERDNKKCRICAISVVPVGERIVHHIDANKNNNVLENLILLCRSCHSRVHSRSKTNDPVLLAFRSVLYT